MSTSDAGMTSTEDHAGIAAPKKKAKKKAVRRAQDRSVQRTADRHNPFFNFRPLF